MNEMAFKRQQFKLKKLGSKWRKPKGRQSKLRIEKKGRWKKVKIGYGSPKSERNLINIKGEFKKPVRIANIKDLEKIDPNTSVGIIVSSVGKKKSDEIIKKANEIGLKILNRKLIKKK